MLQTLLALYMYSLTLYMYSSHTRVDIITCIAVVWIHNLIIECMNFDSSFGQLNIA